MASYGEDARTREMRYVPREESPYSVRVVHKKATGAWETFKYRGETVVCEALVALACTIAAHTSDRIMTLTTASVTQAGS